MESIRHTAYGAKGVYGGRLFRQVYVTLRGAARVNVAAARVKGHTAVTE
jgi:hypothetical protein